jgi:hypothetical protein
VPGHHHAGGAVVRWCGEGDLKTSAPVRVLKVMGDGRLTVGTGTTVRRLTQEIHRNQAYLRPARGLEADAPPPAESA